MSTSNAVAQGIYTKLTAGTALTALLAGTASVYWMQAPDNATMPYVVYNHQGGGAINNNPHDTRDMVYYIRAYAARQNLAGSIDTAISNLLHRGTITVSGYSTLRVVRETDIEIVDNALNGSKTYSCGAIYRILLDN
jgi:hypothetical protein